MPAPDSIFICYSHKQPHWKDLLLKHLSIFDEHGLIEVWHDKEIAAGSAWDLDIEKAITRAGLALILLSEDVLQSEYILARELTLLRQRHEQEGLKVIPILCEPCKWQDHEWLASVQIRPFDTNALSELAKDEALRSLRQITIEVASILGNTALERMPLPPDPVPATHIFLSNLPATYTTTLIGRDQEIALLNLALVKAETSIVSLVGAGGTGKTALVQHWLKFLKINNWCGIGRVYCWSFYGQGTSDHGEVSEDPFLTHALEWFGHSSAASLSPWEKGQQLADMVIARSTLLILDGLEPLQYPPGPMGGKLRSPGIEVLLQNLASRGRAGLCIVTTREPLTDFKQFRNFHRTGGGALLQLQLSNLTEDAGAALLHFTGVRRAGAAEIEEDNEELRAASRSVDGHALTLTLLGSFLCRAYCGDILRRDRVQLATSDAWVMEGHAFRMLRSYEKWLGDGEAHGVRMLAVLRLLGLFDRQADVGCLAALMRGPVIPGLTDELVGLKEEDWNLAVSSLAECGLVYKPKNLTADIDTHPLIREYFANRVQSENPQGWRLSHVRLHHYLLESAVDMPEDSHQLVPLLSAITHGCKAMLHSQVLNGIYKPKMVRGEGSWIVDVLGLHGDNLQTLAAFFDVTWSHVSSMLDPKEQAFVSGEAAFSLRALVRYGEAEPLMEQSVRLAESAGDFGRASYNNSNLMLILNDSGKLDRAMMVGRKGWELAERSLAADENKHKNKKLLHMVVLAGVLTQAGEFEQALRMFEQAEALQNDFKEGYDFLFFNLGGFKFCDLLLQLGRCEEVRQRISYNFKKSIENGNLLSIAYDHLCMGKLVLAADDQDSSELRRAKKEHFDTCIDVFKKGANQVHLATALVQRAICAARLGRLDEAAGDLNCAWEISARGPMLLVMADIHLNRVRLFAKARRYPWGIGKDGMPRGADEDLAAARAVIAKCGYWRRKEELEVIGGSLG